MLDMKGTVRTHIYIYLIVRQIEHIITITITGSFLLAQRFVIYIMRLNGVHATYAYNLGRGLQENLLLPHSVFMVSL